MLNGFDYGSDFKFTGCPLHDFTVSSVSDGQWSECLPLIKNLHLIEVLTRKK